MEIKQLQTELAKIDPRYVDWLRLEKKDGIIKGYPTRKLSIEASTAISKFFKELGGSFCAKGYYQLRVKRGNSRHPVAKAFRELQNNGGIYKEA